MKGCAADVARLLTACRTDTHDGTLNDVPTQTQAQPGCHNYIGNKIENICMCTWREAPLPCRSDWKEKKFPIKCIESHVKRKKKTREENYSALRQIQLCTKQRKKSRLTASGFLLVLLLFLSPPWRFSLPSQLSCQLAPRQ